MMAGADYLPYELTGHLTVRNERHIQGTHTRGIYSPAISGLTWGQLLLETSRSAPLASNYPDLLAELLENVKVIRGVEAVGLVNCVPLSRSLHWLLQIVSCRFPVSVAIAQEWRDNPAPLRNW
jgi:hypothetical protein